jgi:hypothetical protein
VTRARVRVPLAILLTSVTIALIVWLDFVVENMGWRVLFLFCACVMIVVVVLLLPSDWRKRLGPVAAVFVAAAGALSVFLVSPQSSVSVAKSSPPVVDAQQMAAAVADSPFDQQLPHSLQAGALKRITVGDPSSAGKLVASNVPIKVPSSSPLAGSGLHIYAEVEVYPTAQDASQRGKAQLEYLSATFMTPNQRQTIAGFCVYRSGGNAWVCGGVRGHAYAETTLTPAATAFLGTTQGINSALLSYAQNKETLATHQR